MKRIKYSDLRRRLRKAGFYEAGQTGSHVKFAKEIAGGLITTIVPKHREVSSGTLRSILRQANLTEVELDRL